MIMFLDLQHSSLCKSSLLFSFSFSFSFFLVSYTAVLPNAECQCTLPDGMKNCKNLPAKMEIDFIRLYQVSLRFAESTVCLSVSLSVCQSVCLYCRYLLWNLNNQFFPFEVFHILCCYWMLFLLRRSFPFISSYDVLLFIMQLLG